VTHGCPQASAAPLLDLLVVGCGLRATGLLTATPALLGLDTGIVDAADQLGVGSFRDYDIESNSSGSDFFGWIDPAGEFGPLLARGPVARLRAVPGAFQLSMLARALSAAGDQIGGRLAPGRLFLRERVTQVEAAGDGPVAVRTSAGRLLRARAVVLAAGIRERPSQELAPWASRLVPSGSLITPASRARCAELASQPGPVCFAGASHSAFSVLRRLLAARPAGGPEIVLVSRSPVKLYYPDWAGYAAVTHPGAEAVPDPDASRCQETGSVHRYSGLRNTSRALFRAVALGEVPGVRLAVVPDAAGRAAYFERAGVVITATGYQSNLPVITAGGAPAQVTTAAGLAAIDGQGRLQAGGVPLPGLFVMGMDPYPYKDNSINPTSQYARRGRDIFGHLSASCQGDHRPVRAMRRI
jgi:ribosomal protein S14